MDEIYSSKDSIAIPGGSALNSARTCNYML